MASTFSRSSVRDLKSMGMIFTPKSGVKKLTARLYYGFLTRLLVLRTANKKTKYKITNINAV